MRGRAGPSLPQITRVKFAWLVFAAWQLSEGLASQANMMVSVKLTIILPKKHIRKLQAFGHSEMKTEILTFQIIWFLREMRQKRKKMEGKGTGREKKEQRETKHLI